MTDGYAYIMPMRGYINLGFYQGAVPGGPRTAAEAPQGSASRKNPFPWPRPTDPCSVRSWQRPRRRRSGATGQARASLRAARGEQICSGHHGVPVSGVDFNITHGASCTQGSVPRLSAAVSASSVPS